jgi:hypothetical protein
MARERRVYADGYKPKIAYWEEQLSIAISRVDEAGVKRAMDKLEYFRGRQAELDEA